MEVLPDELLLYVVSFLLSAPSRSAAGSPTRVSKAKKWRSARREPHSSDEAVAAVARVAATCRRLYYVTESVWRDLHRWRFSCSPFRELQAQPPPFSDPSLQGRWREHYIRDVRWSRIDEIEPHRALLPTSMRRRPFGCNLMVDTNGGVTSRTRTIYVSGDKGKVHSLVLRRGERRLVLGTTYDLGNTHSRHGRNPYRMPALKQTRDWLVACGNSGLCAFRKGDPYPKLSIHEAEGEIEFAINQDKAWLVVSRGSMPDTVAVYDLEKAQLTTSISIPRDHCTSGLVTQHDCLVVGGAASLLVVDLRTGDVVKELVPTGLYNATEKVRRWHMAQDDVSDTFLCSALGSAYVYRWSDLEEYRSLHVDWESDDVSYNQHAIWCPTGFGMRIASLQPPHREITLRTGETSFAYADGRKAIMAGNIFSVGQKCVVVHDFATCERRVFHPPGDCEPLRHLYTAVADDLLVTVFDHNLALWDLALSFP